MKYRNYKISIEVEYGTVAEYELNEDESWGEFVGSLIDEWESYQTGTTWYRVYRPNEEYQGSYDTEEYTIEDIKRIIDNDIIKLNGANKTLVVNIGKSGVSVKYEGEKVLKRFSLAPQSEFLAFIDDLTFGKFKAYDHKTLKYEREIETIHDKHICLGFLINYFDTNSSQIKKSDVKYK